MRVHRSVATSDNELLVNIAAGSHSALEAFYHRHHSRVYSFALKRLGNPADAAEVLNDVMLQVWRAAASFKEHSLATTWLLGIAHHKSIDLLRKRGRNEADEFVDDIADDELRAAPAAIERMQTGNQIHRCLEKLPQSHRHVVYLTFFEDLSYPEIARILEIPEGTVKTRMFHARKRLKECLSSSDIRS